MTVDQIKKFDIATCVTDSLIDVFDMMLSFKLEFSEDQKADISGERIVGAVSLGGRVMGCVTIQVDGDFSRQMTASMLDVTPAEIKGEDDIRDVISEICNIVGGNLKSTFCDAGLICELSPPAFTLGNDFKIESLNTDRHERYVFNYQDHFAIVEVGVRISEAEIDADTLDAQGGKALDPMEVKKFDVRGSVTKSLCDVFDTMLSLDLQALDDLPAGDDEGGRVVGSVSFVGPLMGGFNFYVTEPFSRVMTAAMLGMEVEELEGEEEVKDVVSELCNIVGGNLKSKFCDTGLRCELSTPSYTTGNDFKIESRHMITYEHIAFQQADNVVFVEVGIKTADQKSAMPEQPSQPGADVVGHETIVQDAKVPETTEASGDLDQSAIDNLLATAPSDVPQGASDSAGHPAEDGLLKELEAGNLDFIMDIPLEITVQMGKTQIPIRQLLDLDAGSIVKFPNIEDETLDILANKKLIARGKVVIVNEKYGLRITEIVGPRDRIKSLK